MQRDATVTQLSLKGLFSLLDEGKKGIIVQIIESEMINNQRVESKSLKFKISISDGYTKYKAVLGSDAATAFEAAGCVDNAVVRVLDLMQPGAQTNKRIVVITKMDILNTDVNEVIGQPIDYNEWLANGRQNKNGSNQIPARFLPNYKPIGGYNNNSNSNGFNNNPMNNNMNNHNMSNMNNNNNSNNFNKAPFNQNNNAINTNTPVNFNNPGARNNFNSAPNNNNFNSATNNNNNNSRQSFNSTNNGNNFGNNNKNFINQNENIPPYGTNNNNNNNSKGGKRVSAVSFINDASNIPDNEFIPVNLLAPFSQFLIKVRVTNKSDVREFKKNGGPEMGKLFSVDLIDKEGYEISATFFGDAVDKWFPVIFENQVYIMGGGQVKVINSKFNKKPKHEYQIIFEATSDIRPVDNDTDIMVNKFSFVKIGDINNLEANSNVDIAAYVKSPGEVRSIPIKKNTETKERRVVTIYDDSNVLVEFTCWGDSAKAIDVQSEQLILIKDARITEFNGIKSLSHSFGTKIITDRSQFPESQEIQNLINWRNNEYSEEGLQSMVTGGGNSGNRKYNPWTIDEIEQVKETISEKGFFETTAYVRHIKSEGIIMYPGCVTETCSKKANDFGGMYRCETCNKEFATPNYRYTLSFMICDQTGSTWVRAFDKVGAAILGHEANAINQMKSMGNDVAVSEAFREAQNKEYNFRIFAKRENNQNGDGTRIGLQVTRVEKIDYAKDSRSLINLIDEFSQLSYKN